MKENKQPTLRRLIRHAELYGTEFVYETARDTGLGFADLGSLVLHLKRVEPKYRLPRSMAQELAVELAASGMTLRNISERCSMSVPTVRKALREASKSERNGPTQDIEPYRPILHAASSCEAVAV